MTVTKGVGAELRGAHEPFAEIVQSSLGRWCSQAWQWDVLPRFGSVMAVECDGQHLLGLVYDIEIGSSDPARTVIAYGKTFDELKAEQPQIFEFLETTFWCVSLGVVSETVVSYQLPRTPPKIHSFVRLASSAQLTLFFEQHHYLRQVFNLSQHIVSIDEALLALLQYLFERHVIASEELHHFIQTFSLVTGNDYRRLKLFLQRVEHMLGSGY